MRDEGRILKRGRRLESAGQEAADHGPVDGGDVGIGRDLAGAARTPDESVVEESDDRACGHAQEYLYHLLLVQSLDFFSHDAELTISAKAYIVKSGKRAKTVTQAALPS